MADPVFDIESFERLDRSSQEAAAQGVGAMKQAAEAGMLLGDANFDQYAAMNDYAGKAGKALVGLDIATSVAEGRPDEAVETAGEWLAGEALSNGFSDALKQTTHSPDFGQGMGWGQDVRDAWADAVGGAMADATQAAADGMADAGKWLKDRATDTVQNVREYNTETRAGRIELQRDHAVFAQRLGGAEEYGHFEELPYQYGDRELNEGTMPRTAERPEDYGLGHDMETATMEAANRAFYDPLSADYGLSSAPPFVTRDPAIRDLSDFVTVEGDSVRPGDAESLRFDLNIADRLDTTLRANVADHASAYASSAEFTDGRDFGTSLQSAELRAAIRDTATGADEALVELRQLGREFETERELREYLEDGHAAHRFDGGELRAGAHDAAVHHTDDGTHVRSAAGGAVLVGRDDGRHMGGAGADLSLDADTAHLGQGDDVALLDNEAGRFADGGAGHDTLIGGRGEETLIGGAGADHIRSGAGADELHGGTVDDAGRSVDDNTHDRLAPGAGADTVFAGDGDVVEAAVAGGSQADTLHLCELHLRGPVDAQGRATGLDADGRGTGAAGETYALDRDTGELSVTHDGRSLTVEGYTAGDFGLEPAMHKEAALSAPAPSPPTLSAADPSLPAPSAREILSSPDHAWATPGYLPGLVGPDGSVPGVSVADGPRAGLGGLVDRARAAFTEDAPGLALPEMFEEAHHAIREVASLDREELGGAYRSPEGWRLAHPETMARADALRSTHNNGLMRDTRVEVELEGPDGTPLPPRERAEALADGIDRAAAGVSSELGHAPHRFPRALSGPQAEFDRAHPVPGSEESLVARGDAGALEREAGREAAREAGIEASREALMSRSLADIDREASLADEYGAGL